MNIGLLTGNQPRHISLANRLSSIADNVYVTQEVSTLLPGSVEDFYKKSDIMQKYFSKVIEAERKVFGESVFTKNNVNTLSMKSKDISKIPINILKPILDCDIIIVFGASYIKGELIEILIEKKAVNIHMGVSPFYRGCDCNFWALNDKRPDLVGATIHYLTKGLDSGPMLYHALPSRNKYYDAFELGMRAVEAAHISIVQNIINGKLFKFSPIFQDKSKEIRYTRASDFNDTIAQKYLNSIPEHIIIKKQLMSENIQQFLNPFIAD